MNETESTAKDLYDAYCAAVGGRAYNNDPLPTWEAFRGDSAKQKQSDGWIAVAKKAEELFWPHSVTRT